MSKRTKAEREAQLGQFVRAIMDGLNRASVEFEEWRAQWEAEHGRTWGTMEEQAARKARGRMQ